jgi:CHAT domain-containing protein
MRLALFVLILAAGQDSPNLVLGTPLRAGISGTQTRSYWLNIPSSQFARILLQQGETDLQISAFASGGKKVAEVDCWDRGPESLTLDAQESGMYRIEVAGKDPSAPLSTFTLELRELRPQDPDDRTWIDAEKLSSEAHRLLAIQSAESIRQGVEKQRQALELWRKLKNPHAEAFSLLTIGEAEYGMSDFPSALDHFLQALPIVRTLGDRHAEAECLSNAAAVQWEIGGIAEALTDLRQSLIIWDDLGFDYGRANALSNLAALEWEAQDWRASLSHRFQARTLIQKLGDKRGEAYILNNIGQTYSFLGENTKALHYLSEARGLFQATNDRLAAGRALLHIAQIHLSQHEVEPAVTEAKDARESLRIGGDRSAEADAIALLAQAHVEKGDFDAGMAEYQQALHSYHDLGLPRGESAALHNMGVAYAGRDDLLKARESLEESLKIRTAVGLWESEAATHYQLSKIERREEKWPAAREHLNAALQITERLRTRLAGDEIRSSYFASKQLYYQEYVDLLMQSDRGQPRQGWAAKAFEAAERARARVLIDLLESGHDTIHRDTDSKLLDRNRELQMRINVLAHRQLRVLTQAGGANKQLAIRRELESLVTQQQELETQIRSADASYAALTQSVPLTLPEIQREVLDEDTLLLQFSLGEARSYLWVVSKRNLLSFSLPARKEIETYAERVRALWSHANRNPNASADSDIKRLAAMILGPAARFLSDKRLAIVSEGSLQRVPFSALPDPATGQPLIARHDIVNLPSASALAASRREAAGRAPPHKLIAVFADPVFEADDPRVLGRAGKNKVVPPPGTRSFEESESEERGFSTGTGPAMSRLPFSRREAEQIMRLAPPGQRMLARDFDANKKNATDPSLADYRIVHFATHGVLDDRESDLSGIVLSLYTSKGEPQDGFLRLGDILNLRLRADLVVLSACQTALGRDVRGEGLLSVTRGFMFAGGQRIVASLWKVDDFFTSELMRLFYGNLLGPPKTSPARALRAAQNSMRHSDCCHDPYAWAGFSLQGEWR